MYTVEDLFQIAHSVGKEICSSDGQLTACSRSARHYIFMKFIHILRNPKLRYLISKKPITTSSYPEPDESSLHPSVYLFIICIILEVTYAN